MCVGLIPRVCTHQPCAPRPAPTTSAVIVGFENALTVAEGSVSEESSSIEVTECQGMHWLFGYLVVGISNSVLGGLDGRINCHHSSLADATCRMVNMHRVQQGIRAEELMVKWTVS
jgi:hypothetical protein